MRINVNYKFHNLDHSYILKNETEALDLKEIILTALVQPKDEPQDIKVKKFKLSQKIFEAKDIAEISLDDAQLIKLALPQNLSPVIIGQAVAVLEGDEPHWRTEYVEIQASTEHDSNE